MFEQNYSFLGQSFGNIVLIIKYFIYLIAVFGIGELFLKVFRIKFENEIEKRTFQFGLGNIFYSLIFIYLGIFHLLYYQILMFIYILPSVFLLLRLKTNNFKNSLIAGVNTFLNKKIPLKEIIIVTFLIIMCLPIFPYLFSFPTAWDPLAYHLMLPKLYLQDHALTFYDWFPQTTFPLGIESLFGYGEVFGDPRLSNFIVFTFIVAAVIYLVYGLRYLFPKIVLLLALYLFLYKNIFYSQVSFNPFVDFPLAFYGLLISLTLIRYLGSAKNNFLLLLLFLSLFSVLIKLSGAIVVLSVLLTLLIIWFFNRKKAKFQFSIRNFLNQKSLIVLLLIIFPIIYWFGRNYIFTNNPVYPFLNNIFKGLNYNEESVRAMMADIKSLTLTSEVLLDTTLRTGNYQAGYGILKESLFFLILLIFPLFAIFNEKEVIRYSSLFGLIFLAFVIYFTGLPSYRYALPLMPLMAILTSFVFFRMLKRMKWYYLPFIILLIFSLLLQFKTTTKTLAFFSLNNLKNGLQSMLSYEGAKKLLTLQDNWYGISYANNTLDKKKDKILSVFDNRLYYFDVPIVYANPSISGLFTNPKTETIEEIYNKIGKMGITYVFVNNNWGIHPNLRKELYYSFLEKYLEPVFSASGTVLYRVK